MSTNAISIAHLGLRESGKTSYLAALWHALEGHSSENPKAMRLVNLPKDREYLNGIRDRWLRCESVDRTPTGIEEYLTMSLQLSKGPQFEVTVPDLAGEALQLQWETRQASKRYRDYVSTATGVALFVHPGMIQQSTRLEALKARKERPAGTPAEVAPWDPGKTSTQVRLVDLLQNLLWLRGGAAPLKAAVLVSAWDTIASGIDVSEWLPRRLPLLHQFLSTNDGISSYECFGVSAQGCDYRDDGAKASALDSLSADARAWVVSQSGRSPDITAPLRWLVEI